MPEYLNDPSVLTKERLKSELLAHNVELPGGNPTKDVYVQLYLKNLTTQNKLRVPAATLDAFSSDEELPPPVVSGRSRSFGRSGSSGRKATKKTDKLPPDELDVTVLTDQGLRDELLKMGMDVGPVVASTRKLYEKRLQKLLDNEPVELPQLVLKDIQINHNGNSESDPYSDKEDEVTPEPEPEVEPEPEPEPVPVVERTVTSRGKTPVTTRTQSSQHHTVEKIAASEQVPQVEEKDVMKKIFPNDINSPTGITATCRRPIRGAASRPVTPGDMWNDEKCLFSSLKTKLSPAVVPTSSRPSPASFSASSRLLAAAAPPSDISKPARSGSLWKKLLLLAAVASFLFLVYQAMEADPSSPFKTEEARSSA
ncbi:unnamed protein product [Ophioblennius macclurei]